MKEFNRRTFVKGLTALGVSIGISEDALAGTLRYFKPKQINNPLAAYPNRDWEKVYRNLFKPDSSFVFFMCPK